MSDSLKSICRDYGLSSEGVRYALEQYQKVIFEITDGLLSKLTYDADTIINKAYECYERAFENYNEPRVMTLEEVKAFDWEYCYLEEERLPGKEYRAVCGDYALTCITWPCVTSMRIQHGDESYGRKWRCWTAKPTDEQRGAVKWDG